MFLALYVKWGFVNQLSRYKEGRSIHIHNFYCSRRADSDYRKLDFTMLKQKPDIK